MENERLLISLVIPTYRQEAFVAEAIQAAFQQTYSPLEIIISDDASPDGTYQVIQREAEKYSGPHELIIRRNQQNLGLAGQINLLSSMARGELIVGAAGDDISLPNRVEKVVEAYRASQGKSQLIFSNAYQIDEQGNKLALMRKQPPPPEYLQLDWLANRMSGVIGCASAWSSKVFQVFGPMDDQVIHEDLVIPFRAALLGEIAFLNEPLVLYRRHSGNLFLDANHKGGVNIERLHNGIERRSKNYAAIYKTRINDLKIMMDLFPENSSIYERLIATSEKKLWEAAIEGKLIKASSHQRAAIFLEAIRKRTPVRKLSRWFIELYFPKLYLGYQAYASSKVKLNLVDAKDPE